MPKYLVIEYTEDDYEYDRTFTYILEGDDFRDALNKSHFDESLREVVINVNPDREEWPKLDDCKWYVPNIRVYEIASIPEKDEIQTTLRSYLNDVLQGAIKEEIQYRAGQEEREKAEQLEALQAQAKKLGMKITPDEKV